MHRHWQKTTVIIFISSIFLFLLSGTVLVEAGRDSGGKPEATPVSGPERAVEKAVRDELEARDGIILAAVLYETRVQNIRLSGDGQWAAAEMAPFDPQAEMVLPVEPGLAILRRQGGEWKVTLPTDRQWKAWLQLLPEDVMDAEAVGGWLEIYESTELLRPEAPLGGYKLPWPFGQTRNVSQSTAHDRWRSDGMDHFAWDFYGFSGGASFMWDVLAARPGKVYMRKDSEPNGCDQTSGCTGNWMVLKDESTYPVTYQLYLHLAQNSIPDNLQIGDFVNQGQLIGVADDTGFSTGHHLHFMVHTASYSYWGTAVDITFDDVDINGGRPRVLADKDYCTRPEDVCNSFRTGYVSGNKPDPEPPTGDFSNISQGQLITSSMPVISGWGADVSTGFNSAQLLAAPTNGSWQVVGSAVFGSPFSMTVDLCQSGLPVGPTGLGLRLMDKSGYTIDLTGLRWVTLDFSCSPPPVPAACVPGAGQAALFDDVNFQGTCKLFNPGGFGNSSNLSPLGGGRASSILLGSGARVTLYNKADFAGRAETFKASDSNLADNRIQNNTVNSLFVRSTNDQPFGPQPFWPPTGQVIPQTNSVTLYWLSDEGDMQYQVELTTPTGAILTTGWLKDPWWNLADGQTLKNLGTYSWRVRSRVVEAPPPLDVLPKYPNQVYLPLLQQGGAEIIIASPWSGPTTFTFQHQDDRMTTSVKEHDFNDIYANPPVEDEATTSARWTPMGLWRRETSVVQGPRGWGDMYFWYGERDSSDVPNYSTAHSGALTSPPIELESATPYLRFWYYYDTEVKSGDITRGSTQYWDQRWVQVSVDNGPFINLFQLSGEAGGEWQQSPYIRIPATDGQVIRLRFYFDTMDGLPTGDAPDNYYTGWLVDDTRILSSAAAPCSDANEPDNSPRQATILNGPYQSVSNAMVCVGDVDYYAFNGGFGQRVGINIDAHSLLPASPLDSVVELFDSDGNSVLANNDDEVPGNLDSNLSYLLPRSGQYFFRVHHYYVYEGGNNFKYNLNFSLDGSKPQVNWLKPISGGWVTKSAFPLSVQATDGQSGVEKVEFFMHNSNWNSLAWVSLGQASGSNGVYSLVINPETAFGAQANMAFFAQVTDRSGNAAVSSVWNLRTDLDLPGANLEQLEGVQSTNAFRLSWGGADVTSGLDHFEVQRQVDGGAWQDLYASTLLTDHWEIIPPDDTAHIYSYRMRSVDKAGNTSPYLVTTTSVPDAATLCANAADELEVDNTFQTAKPLALSQRYTRSFCNPEANQAADTDWVSLEVEFGKKYWWIAYPQPGSPVAPVITLFGSDEQSPIAPGAMQSPALPGSSASIFWISNLPGTATVRLRIVNADPAIIGAKYYLLGFLEQGRIYLPAINR